MTETVDREHTWHSPPSSADAPAGAGPDAAERRFRLGVAAITLAAGVFLALRLTAWPPHEDETLALFIGRNPLDRLFSVVLEERGGAPLHFLVAWAVAHVGGGLEALRGASALFAVASLPLVAALGRRLADRRTALVATALVAASWMLLFHGVYGRMYSLFLCTSLLSYLALLVAVERGGRRRWAVWVGAVLLTVATHPYGALVFASQVVYAAIAGGRERRAALTAAGAAAFLGIPFWLTDLRLAGRFDVTVGGGGAKLGGPWEVVRYLWDTAGDFTAGYRPVLAAVLAAAAYGAWQLWRRHRAAAVLGACALGVPVAAFLGARLGSSTSPESRHLIFVLPFFALALAAAAIRLWEQRPGLAGVAVAGLVAAQLAWGWQKTPPLYEGEPDARVEARAAASAWLAATGRPDDVLFGYDPLFLGAWERDSGFARTVVPRADVKLAMAAVRKADSLGRGVWVFDASDTNNFDPRPTIRLVFPQPQRSFEARTFGPFLVIRTREPTRTPETYFRQARRAQLVGKALFLGDADINYQTVVRASRRLSVYVPRSRSSS